MVQETYASDRQSALDAITEAGAGAKIVRSNGTDPADEYPCPVLCLSFSSFDIDGQLIRKGDIKLMIPAQSFPDNVVIDVERDRLVINDARPEFQVFNGNWRITFAHPFAPGGRAIYYDAGGRKL